MYNYVLLKEKCFVYDFFCVYKILFETKRLLLKYLYSYDQLCYMNSLWYLLVAQSFFSYLMDTLSQKHCHMFCHYMCYLFRQNPFICYVIFITVSVTSEYHTEQNWSLVFEYDIYFDYTYIKKVILNLPLYNKI